MLFRFISYINFLRCSTNQHDVHSPFVYDFVTKCLYNKPRRAQEKTLDVLLKSIKYFNYKSVFIEKNESYKKETFKHYPDLSWADKHVDLIYLHHPNLKDLRSILSNNQIDNDSMIIVNNIFDNVKSKKIWTSITALPEITVSINLFYCGILFFRQAQLKEHFTIRI